LLHVSDEDVWSYGEALREIAREKKLVNINFVRVTDLLNRGLEHIPHRTTCAEDRASYLASVSSIRNEFVERYTPPGYDARKTIKEDTDTCLTYTGYVRFLKKDLEYIEELKIDKAGKSLSATQYTKVIKSIAQAMLTRGAAFAAAIRTTHGDFIRLSIHPTTGVTKFPVQLLPQKLGKCSQTPWHSTIALALDGSFITGYVEDFITTHELVHRDGRPYYFREKSDVFDWGDLKIE
jgi:pyoverdine/dityrosine biosynthesis protein Dit1